MFQGFSQATGDFLWGLAMNNDRAWFEAHRDQYEAHLNQPFRALTADTLAAFQQRCPALELRSHISRIYRDARRLFGRGPFKDHLWFTLYEFANHNNGPVFWFELSGTGWSRGMGVWDDKADVSEAFRRRIDADPQRFAALVRELDAQGGYTLYGEPYKRPRGDRGETINPWYNRRLPSVGWERSFDDVLFDPSLPDILAGDFERLLPMYMFMREVWLEVLTARAARQQQGALGGESV